MAVMCYPEEWQCKKSTVKLNIALRDFCSVPAFLFLFYFYLFFIFPVMVGVFLSFLALVALTKKADGRILCLSVCQTVSPFSSCIFRVQGPISITAKWLRDH